MSAPSPAAGALATTSFSFEGAEVRTVTIDDEPWFVGKDVCDRLGYANATDAMNKHCKGVAKRYPLQTAGGVQRTRMLSEADVLRLIVSSNLPTAQRFERWVFEDVLPEIRKSGGYMATAPIDPKQIGGIVKSVVNRALDDRLRPMEHAILTLDKQMRDVAEGYDQRQGVVTDFSPMLEILLQAGIGSKKRRQLSQQCSSRCRRWLLSHYRGSDVRVSRETGRYLFREAGWRDWLKIEGARLIAEHKAKIEGQGTLKLVPKRPKPAPC